MRVYGTHERFPTLRLFGIASLVSIVLTAVLLFELFRQTAISAITEIGEQTNVGLAHATLNPVRDLLIAYLEEVNVLDGKHPSNAEMEEVIGRLMENTEIKRVKIYDDHGHVAYSTKNELIGKLQLNNPGFVAAMNGEVFSKLIYRDTFNLLDGEHEDANLIQTYVPVRKSPAHPVIGVFEIYRDVNAMVVRTERAEILIIAGVSAILVALFAFLYVVVRYSDRIIVAQQYTIRERTRTLELLAAQMLNAQEAEKRDMAGELHEGVAQTLGGVKAHLEALEARSDGEACNDAVGRLVPIVQDAIQEVRGLAMQLRPSSLDDLGLVATLNWLTRSFNEIYGIEVTSHVEISEADIPHALKVIVYRVAQEALHSIGRSGGATQIDLQLAIDNEDLVLSMSHNRAGYVAETGAGHESADLGWGLVKERTVLSGGNFRSARSPAGYSFDATWPLLLADDAVE